MGAADACRGFPPTSKLQKGVGGVWSAGAALKEPFRCLNAAQQNVFFVFFLFRFSCKFTHPADLRRDAPSLPSSSAADRDLRLLATAFDIISIGSLLSVYLFFYLPFFFT